MNVAHKTIYFHFLRQKQGMPRILLDYVFEVYWSINTNDDNSKEDNGARLMYNVLMKENHERTK